MSRAGISEVSIRPGTGHQEMEGVILICRIAGGSTFSVYQTEYAGRADHTTAQWHVGDVAFMRDVGKAAWSTDSEINILCLDDGFPGERVG